MFAPISRDRNARKSLRIANKSGQTMMLFVLGFATMLALLGLVFDGGRIYFEKRHMQAAADAGAFAGVHELKRAHRDPDTQVKPAARHDVDLNGYDANNSTVTVNNPPASGPQAGNPNFVEVMIEQIVPTTFMRIVSRNQSIVRVRSTAGMVIGGDPCIVALNETVGAALRINGSASLEADCGIVSNSSAGNAINSPSSGGCVTATWGGTPGGINGSCLNFTGGTQIGMAPIVDPLATLDEPDPWPPSGSFNNLTNTYSPGVINTPININGGSYTFNPGLYVITNGFRINGGMVRGAGVTFLIVNSNGTQSKSVTITGGDVRLSAPTSGYYQGILFFGSRSNPNWGLPGNQIVGNNDSVFQGAIYFPNEHIDVAGNTSANNAWAMVIGDTLDFVGNSVNRFIRQPTDPATAPPIFRVALIE